MKKHENPVQAFIRRENKFVFSSLSSSPCNFYFICSVSINKTYTFGNKFHYKII